MFIRNIGHRNENLDMNWECFVVSVQLTRSVVLSGFAASNRNSVIIINLKKFTAGHRLFSSFHSMENDFGQISIHRFPDEKKVCIILCQA